FCDVLDLLQLGLDVGPGHRPVGRTVHAHARASFLALRAPRASHTSAPPSARPTITMMYGTHDQSPLKVSPVSVCRARSPDIARNTTPSTSTPERRSPNPT